MNKLSFKSLLNAINSSKTQLNGCKRGLQTMKAWQLEQYTNDITTGLKECSVTIPYIHGHHDVLVQVKASSVNPIDVMMCNGYGHDVISHGRLLLDCGHEKTSYDCFPVILGRDFSGVVVGLGRSVKTYKIGDEIWGATSPFESGSHSSYVTVSESNISKKPANLTYEEAAAIPYAGLTSWSAITCFGGLNSNNTFGKRILVLGGSGGLGTFSIQLLKAWGASVTTTCSTNAVNWLQEITHADAVIDYSTNELMSMAEYFDMILDYRSHDNKQTIDDLAIKTLKRGCNAKYISTSSPLLKTIDENGLIIGIVKSSYLALNDTFTGLKDGKRIRWAFYAPNKHALIEIKKLVEQGQIRPVIQKRYNFNCLPQAYSELQKGHARGKTVISMIES